MDVRIAVLSAAIAACGCAAFAGPVPDDAAKSALEENPNLTAAPQRLLVGWRKGSSLDSRRLARSLVGGKMLRELRFVPDLELVEVPFGEVDVACDALNALADVEFAEPDYVVHPTDLPNDEYFPRQWGLDNEGQRILGRPGYEDADIDAPEGWQIVPGSADFVIAIVDTGVNYTHPDLAANIWTNPDEIPGNGIDDDNNGYIDDVHGWDFYNSDNDPSDPSDHGTHVAGIIGAERDNGIGVAGVLSPVQMMPLRFLGPSGGFVSDVVLAMEYATDKGVRVSNHSWGGGAYSSSLRRAIIQAGNRVDHLFVCASGNFGWDLDLIEFYPPAYDLSNMICVAATSKRDGVPDFVNFSPSLVDIAAPGKDIFSTSGLDEYRFESGTSMAAPYVTGITAAVCIAHPNWNYHQVKQQVLSTARPVDALIGITANAGVANMADALAGVQTNDPPVIDYFAPRDGVLFDPDSVVTLAAVANDPQDGFLSHLIDWNSSIQGHLGTGSWINVNLDLGDHEITASVTDSMGWTTTHSVTITVGAPPNKPSPPSVTPAGESLEITWTIKTPPAVSGWQLHRQVLSGKWINTGVTQIDSPDARSYVEAWPDAPSVRYRVRAQNALGWGEWSDWTQINR